MVDDVAGRMIRVELARLTRRRGMVVSVGRPRPAVVAVKHEYCVRVAGRRRALYAQSSDAIQCPQVDLQVLTVVVG